MKIFYFVIYFVESEDTFAISSVIEWTHAHRQKFILVTNDILIDSSLQDCQLQYVLFYDCVF